MFRSAAATSGRRSSSWDGKPTGIGGGALVLGSTGMENAEAGLPMSNGNRMFILCSRNADIHCRGLRALQSCLRFHNGDLVANASVVGSPNNFECFLVGLHCIV